MRNSNLHRDFNHPSPRPPPARTRFLAGFGRSRRVRALPGAMPPPAPDAAIACSTPVAGAPTAGAASIDGDRLVWRPAASGISGERAVALRRVTGHQRNKPGAKTPSLRLVVAGAEPGSKPTALVLTFGAEADRDALSDRIKARVARLGKAPEEAAAAAAAGVRAPPGAGAPAPPSPAELAARRALLASNPGLGALHARLVRDEGVVTEEEFFQTRRKLLSDAVDSSGANQRPGVANALDADIKGTRDGRSDVVTATLSNEKMHRIFSERPAVRRAFLNNVPAKMTEREFWTRFLRSEYFKAARAGAPPQGEEEAADLALFARREPSHRERRERLAGVAAAVNVALDAEDFGSGPTRRGEFSDGDAFSSAEKEKGLAPEGYGARYGGHGVLRDGAKEPPAPSAEALIAAERRLGRSGGKAAATRAQAREVLASLNHHAEVVLRGRPEGANLNLRVADARSAALAAEAQERAGGARASLREAGEAERMQRELVVIDDLVDEAEAPMKTLDIADPSVYFAASEKASLSSSGRKRKANEDEAEEGGAPPKKEGRSGSSPEGFEEAVRAAARWMGVPLERESERKLGASPETSPSRVAAVKAEPGPESTPAAASAAASADTSPLVDPAAARGVLDDLVASIRREEASRRGGWGLPADRPPGGGGGGDGGDVDSSGSDAEAAADAAAAAELLRHFWTAAPMTTAARWEKAARVNAALGELYDRTEARKRETRDGAARHAYARKTKPLADAMDAAFAFFDDEKARRKAAWDAYERGALEKAERERKQREREGGEVVVVE